MERRVLLEPGVVDQDVEGAEALDRFRKHRLHIFLLADIGLDRKGLATGGLDRLHHSLRFVGAGTIIHRYRRPGRAERERAAFANPGAASGDERFLIL